MAESLRLHSKDKLTLPNFDYVVIGGGSGGIASARRAASYGAKVAVIERSNLGGTCVNVGCIPKKLMYNAANISGALRDSYDYGFDHVTDPTTSSQFNWQRFVQNRDAYITRLNGIYYRNLLRDNIYLFRGSAEFQTHTDNDGSIDLSTLMIHATPRSYDNSDNHVKGINLEELTGREIIVHKDHPITLKLQQDIDMATYIGSNVDDKTSSDDATPNQTKTNSILIACGGEPSALGIPGEEYAVNSDGFFALQQQPRRSMVVGSGYIAVELSQVLASLGTKVSLAIRGDTVLRSFDHHISEVLTNEMEKQLTIEKCTVIKRIVPLPKGQTKLDGEREMTDEEKAILFTKRAGDISDTPEQIYGVYVSCNRTCKETNIKTESGEFLLGYFDNILAAIGRKPLTKLLNVLVQSKDASVDILNKRTGCVLIDAIGSIVPSKETKNLFAVGDAVDNGPDLTPVAIQFGRRLSDWLFGGKPQKPLYFETITGQLPNPEDPSIVFTQAPTVVFSHPPIGTAGYTEQQAIAKYGKDNLRIYHSKFNPMYGAVLREEYKSPSVVKLICVMEPNKTSGEMEEIVIGIHVLSQGADEMIQGFGIAVANRLPKQMVDNTIAIHPTVSEELVLFR